MVIALLTVQLFFAENHSLKDKRRHIKSLLDRIRSRFNVSCAEVDNQDVWQRATLGFVCINTSKEYAERNLSYVANLIEQTGEAELLDSQIEIL